MRVRCVATLVAPQLASNTLILGENCQSDDPMHYLNHQHTVPGVTSSQNSESGENEKEALQSSWRGLSPTSPKRKGPDTISRKRDAMGSAEHLKIGDD